VRRKQIFTETILVDWRRGKSNEEETVSGNQYFVVIIFVDRDFVFD
jgi:hypothetical protein